MSDVIVVTYADEGRAAAVMQELRQLRSQDLVDLDDAGYVTKNASGRIKLYEAVPMGSQTSKVSRLLWGDLAGTLMMMPQPAAAVGDIPAAVDDIVSKYGLDRSFVTDFINDMKSGSSAICVLVRRSTPEKVLPQINKFGGTVLRTTLSAEKQEQLQQALLQGPAQATWKLNKGMTVHAKDGDAGKTGDILSDPTTGAQIYFVVESGGLFSKKDVTLPAMAIDYVSGNTAHLKLSKADLEKLPSVPARQRDSWAAGNPENLTLDVRVYDDMTTADQALKVLDDAASQGLIAIYNAAVLTKDAGGKVKIRQRRDRDVRWSAFFGVLVGAMVGGVAVGTAAMAAGAAAGGVVAGGGTALIEAGFPKQFLHDLQASMTPGSSALVVLAEQVWLDGLDMTLNQYGGEVVRQTLTDAMVEGMVQTQTPA